MLCLVLLYPLGTAMAQDMSVPTTRLFGRILARQHKLEKNSSSVIHNFIALFPEKNFPEQIFKGEPPAVFYDFVPQGYIAQTAQAYALIAPPFGGYNFKDIPLGNYWLCQFDIDEDMSEEQILSKTDLMLSGCQYLEVATIQPIQQNYYGDEIGFWFDDFSSQPEDKPQPPEPPTQSDASSECAVEE